MSKITSSISWHCPFKYYNSPPFQIVTIQQQQYSLSYRPDILHLHILRFPNIEATKILKKLQDLSYYIVPLSATTLSTLPNRHQPDILR
jgi:hypothetical protein